MTDPYLSLSTRINSGGAERGLVRQAGGNSRRFADLSIARYGLRLSGWPGSGSAVCAGRRIQEGSRKCASRPLHDRTLAELAWAIRIAGTPAPAAPLSWRFTGSGSGPVFRKV